MSHHPHEVRESRPRCVQYKAGDGGSGQGNVRALYPNRLQSVSPSYVQYWHTQQIAFDVGLFVTA